MSDWSARLLLGFVILAMAPVVRAQDAEEHRLENGLRVVLQPVPERRHVAICVTYHSGSRDVPEGYTGLAHLTEHLMFEGTDAIGEGVTPALERAGAVDLNGITDYDRTVYYEVVPRERMAYVLWLEAERMAHMLSDLDAARLERQRQIVLHEGRQRGRHGSIGRLAALLNDEVYPSGHLYGRVYEQEDDVRSISLAHVQWFFQTHYAPDNATISIVGGFDPAEARAAVDRYFGPIRRSGPAHERPRPAVMRLPSERHVTYEAHTQHDELYILWPTPAYFAPGDAELDVLDELLTGTHQSPMARALAPVTTGFDVRQSSYELGSMFEIHAVAERGHHTGEILEAIDRVLAEVRRTPFSEAEVGAARDRWRSRYRLAIEVLPYLARHLGLRTPDGSVPTTTYEEARYAAVTAESVSRALRDWLAPDHRVVVFVASNPSAPAEGRVVSAREVGRAR